MRVLIAVTHLLGAGHLTRAAALARALAGAGHEAVLVSGGMPSSLVRCGGVRFVQLPPVRIAGTAFSTLLDADGAPAGAALLEGRRSALLSALDAAAPDVVVTELFPFGRRVLAAEFLPLVEAARARRPRPLVLASVRDILAVPERPERIAQAHARIAALYDAVLVHGDPVLAPLDASWPVDAETAKKIRYTGYVDEGGPSTGRVPRAGVLVAAGSGPAGLGLLRAAAEAARRRPDLGWRILVGHGVPEPDFAAIGRGLDGIAIRARPDYRALLAGAALSVSQCGYNTAVDLLATGTPALFVPFAAGGETEQRLRADFFVARGLGRVLSEEALTPDSLIAAVMAGLAAPRPVSHGIDLDGGARSVAIIEAMAAAGEHRRVAAGRTVVHDAETRDGGSHPIPEAPRSGLGGFQPAARSLEGSVKAPCLGQGAPQDEGVWRDRPMGAATSGVSLGRTRENPPAGSIVRNGDPLHPALDRLRAALDAFAERETNKTIAVWWRDDDAVAATPSLDRLLALAAAHGAPLMLAAIPAEAEPSLGRRLADEPTVSLAVHGLRHRNHAPAGAKAAEFGPHRPLAALVRDAAAGLHRARKIFPSERLLPVFVPPWNRFSPDLAAALPGLGYHGLSAVPGPPIAGLLRVDATLDPIEWRGTRSLRDPAAIIDGLIDDLARHPHRPIGLLTHHRMHDEATWRFLDALLFVLLTHPAVTIGDPRHLFGAATVELAGAPPNLARSARVRVG